MSTAGVVAIAAGVTLVALAENSVAPWAPFYIVYVALAVGIPIGLRSCPFGSLRALPRSIWIWVVALPVVLQIAGGVLAGVVYPALAGWAGVDAAALAGPYHSLPAALDAMLAKAAARLGWEPATMQSAYLLFILAWAGLGEELFYRGYMHAALRASHGFTTAAIVSSFFFGIRHATQLALLAPGYPWGAALLWAGFAFLVGLALSWLFERSRSLYPPVLVHYLFNLIPVLAQYLVPAG